METSGLCAAAPFDLFQWLSDDVRSAVRAQMSHRRVRAGGLIYCQDDPGAELFRVVRGEARLSVIRPNGRHLVYGAFSRGDFFGESSLIDGQPRPHTAEAQTMVELDVLSALSLRRLRDAHREIDEALLRLMTRRMRVLSDQVADSVLDELSGRVAARLLATAQSYGFAEAPRQKLNLSQADLASMVGTSRQSVNRALSRLRGEGAVDLAYGRIVIRDLARLQAAAAA